jgi:hypothetical protein
MLCVLLLVACGDVPGEDGGDQDLTACLPDDVLAAIDRHALAGHPSEAEATGFMLAPGLPAPPALSASFAGPLVMTCSEALVYDLYCEAGRCSQLECTGRGAGWRNHLWLEEPVASGGWSFEAVDVSIVWEDGASGTSFTIETEATSPDGRDASMTAEGFMGVDALTVIERFPELHPRGATVLEYTDDSAGFYGLLAIDDAVVAGVDATGHLVATGDCP